MADPQAGVDPQTPPAKPDAPAPDPDSPDPKSPRSYSQDELDRIVNKVRKNTRREVERAVERQFAVRTPEPKKDEPAPEDKEPKRDAFESYEDYQRALAKFEGRQAAREENAKNEQERKQKTERESQEKLARTWQGKIEKAQTKLVDFEDVLEDEPDTLDAIAGSPMRGFITESDIGPEIVYHLCKHPEEAKRIAALPAYKQAAEIAKIEEKLTAAPQKPAPDEEEDPDDAPDGKEPERGADGRFKPDKKGPSKAPEPIEPVGERAANTNQLPSDKDSPEVWLRKRNAQLARRRQGK